MIGSLRPSVEMSQVFWQIFCFKKSGINDCLLLCVSQICETTLDINFSLYTSLGGRE